MIEQLLFESESDTLDFKEKQYRFNNASDNEKSELLKDILAFSNCFRRSDAYILVGVREVKGGQATSVGIGEDLDDAQLQQFLTSKTQRPLEFSYETISHNGVKIGVFRIPLQERPIYLTKDFGKLKKGTV